MPSLPSSQVASGTEKWEGRVEMAFYLIERKLHFYVKFQPTVFTEVCSEKSITCFNYVAIQKSLSVSTKKTSILWKQQESVSNFTHFYL